MSDDFFKDLGDSVSRVARNLGEKTEGFIDGQKIRNKSATLQREVDKKFKEMGTILYNRYVGGEIIDEELADICDQITRDKVEIAKCKEDLASIKGRTVCPACGQQVDKGAAFCMFCGVKLDENDVEDAEFVDEEDSSESGETEETEAKTSDE
ncbi:MAG: zinc-ribbon domain-containing protein [Lachnospiraceae bacterium]